MNIVETFLNLLEQTAFFSLSYGNYLMILVALIFLYLGIAKGFEPLLMVPIAFGMLLVNIYPDIMLSPEKSINGTGGLLWYFFRLDEWTILPSLIFLGVGAQTDFFLVQLLNSVFMQHTSLQSFWDLTVLQQLQSPLSEEQTARLPFSFAISSDRRRFLVRLRLRHTVICHWCRLSSRRL